MTESALRVRAIYTYPIKSIRGCTPESLQATALGFSYDRRFMLIRTSDAQNMHVSKFPEMCLFTTELSSSSSADQTDPDTIIVRYGKDHVFNSPDDKVDPDSLRVPIEPDIKARNLAQVTVTMHQSPTTAYDMGSEFNSWFSDRFGYNVQLLYVAENRRKVLGNVTPHHPLHHQQQQQQQQATRASKSGSWLSSISSLAESLVTSVVGTLVTDQNPTIYRGIDRGIGFADCAPFLIINTKSWENVSARLPPGQEMDISKFRPNIVVEGALGEFEEDYWAEVQVGLGENGGARLVLTANCARCNSLNVDYGTGKVGTSEAGSILKKLQKDRRIDPGMKYSPVFGRYAFLAQRANTDIDTEAVRISVGDSVHITRRNTEHTRFQWPSLSTDR